jgi:hypothetical protein
MQCNGMIDDISNAGYHVHRGGKRGNASKT